MSATSDGDDIQTDYASAPHNIQPQNIIETVPSSPNRERVSEQIIHNSPTSSRSQQTLAGYFIGRRRSGATNDVPRPVPLNLGPAPPLPVFSISENQDASNVLVSLGAGGDIAEINNPPSPEVISSDEELQSNEDVEVVSDPEEENPNLPQDPPAVESTTETEMATMSSEIPDNAQTHPPVTEAAGLAPVVQQIQASTNSPSDFRTPKRRRMMSSPDKPGPANDNSGNDDEDGNSCPICFEEWSTSGSHRLASLKCGHLFGQSCIEKWLKGQGGKCPQCNCKAKRQDIRVLYAKSLKAVDTTERDRALQDLEKEREVRRKIEMEAAQCRLQYQLAIEECNRLKTELDKVKRQLQSTRSDSSSGAVVSQSQARDFNGHFVLDKTIKIWEAGNCRVMSYTPSLATLVVSQPSSSPLFPGFGFKKISCMDFKTSQYLTVHNKAIRDCCFHPFVDDGILLSCGLDKTAKMTSVISNTVVQTYNLANPVWSCIWNTDDRNFFYAGQANGNVVEFDIRNTSEHVQELNTEGIRSPVVSLQYIPKDIQASFRPGGLVVGQLNKISFYEKKQDGQYRLHMLPLEGNLTSLSFENHTRHLLASFRPTSKHPTSRHQLCEMTCVNLSADPAVIDNGCSCHVVHTFHGSQTQTVLTRALLMTHPVDDSRMLVCAGEETSSGVHVWDTSSSQLVQRVPAGGVVVDTCTLRLNQQTYLAALTEKTLRIHRWC
uniref:RING-type E3 ubiquitin transferase n=1 Tax=Crassostrea virginica TaxID=6565 RepID=A0A8B8DJR5_CRAVI|nr:E3 ubiquitin-protein ligase RFWD3-like isoform X1 [Crassostrea virginica]